MRDPKIFKDCLTGLKTVYDTLHKCVVYMEHIGNDWKFCPYCGNELYKKEETLELKPCPFCGKMEMDLMKDTPEGSCSCCGAQVANDKSMKDAISSWNQRD